MRTSWATPKACSASRSAGARRLEHAEHQRRGVLAHRHLDLRDGLPRGEPCQERRQRRDEVPERRRQHGAGLERRDVGLGALAEADEHATALRHVLGAEPRPAPITGRRPRERRQPACGLHAPDARQRLGEFALFGRQLGRRIEMLQRAAAAEPEMGARSLDAVRRPTQHLQQLPLVVLTMAAHTTEPYLLRRQGARHERGLGAADHPLAVVVERRDLALLGRSGRHRAPAHGRGPMRGGS